MKLTSILSFICCLFALSAQAQSLRTGAEQTEKLIPLLEGKRVALVVNQTSVVGPTHTHLLDTLLALKMDVRKVFAPEHGFRGQADAGETVKNGKDIKSGLPILSLYGKNKKPSPEQLGDVDIVVFDIQDVGSRFYTYISTMHYVMEACAENNKRMIVTDRPNPCDFVDGPIREAGKKSFVGMHPIPVLHGCTIGELAQMINGEGWLAGKRTCLLTVIPMEGWTHGQPYSLPVKPSPNLPNDQSIALYASLCPFEGTDISVGRGTYTPFQIIGSPDIPTRDYSFTPQSLEGFDKNPMHKDKTCYGKDLQEVTPPTGLTLSYVIDFYQAYKQVGKADLFFTRANWFDLLMGTSSVRLQIIEGKSEESIRSTWQTGLDKYRQMRSKYLLYR
ncbi:MAG: DUF1343 domain-containing protein [Bacteroidaceae bacterium]|nr:DUF1343 domain-containing protein [Bacteroidaceae bacterium]